MSKVSLESYQAAERSVAYEEGRMGFWWHLGLTVAVSVVLVIVNVTVADEFPWSVLAILGMSLGLAVHLYFGVVQVRAFTQRHQESIERRASASGSATR